ncbi:ABC transporter permease [Paenibacillus nasutitermitis]|uniref:ABC transporter permease YtrF n=1 Tax=Paenibacillus nasutitermitis TaxID=1652958 RepID=A0A917DVZ1_9BACL|nr:FtsX-like permease family protein [Paenibacillus nasutitermitis]GGD75749.1 ABC transporter permease YtrF [Paenibacillus nasutitermitis]
MKTSDKLRFVRQNMKKNKSRIFMTVLATAMGCAFLMMIASVAFGLQKSVINEILQDRSLTEIEMNAKMNGDSYEGLQLSDLDALKQLKHVKAVIAQSRLQATAAVDGYKGNTNAIFSDLKEEAKVGLPLAEGRMAENEGETVVGYHLAEHLLNEAGESYGKSLVGQTLSYQINIYDPQTEKETLSQSFTVNIVGITEKPAKEWRQDIDIRLSDSLLGKILPAGEEPSFMVKVYAKSADSVAELSKTLRAQNYQIYSVADSIKEYDLVFLVMKVGLIFVGTIAVLIASIGIFNTMTMAVTERAQDIGIMKAIGAHPRTIRSVFMLESFGIGLIGVLIGTLIAYGLSALINTVVPPILTSVMDGARLPENFVFSSIPLVLTLVSVAISLGVALLSGMRPAARATRIDVLSALRRDI